MTELSGDQASYENVGESEFECGLPNLPGRRGWLGEQGRTSLLFQASQETRGLSVLEFGGVSSTEEAR